MDRASTEWCFTRELSQMLQGALLHLVWEAWHLTTLKAVLVFECAPLLFHISWVTSSSTVPWSWVPHSNAKCHEKGFPFSVSKLALPSFIWCFLVLRLEETGNINSCSCCPCLLVTLWSKGTPEKKNMPLARMLFVTCSYTGMSVHMAAGKDFHR